MSHSSPVKNGGSNVPPARQIRFVSSDGQPQPKRRRVNAACRTCRKRKIRCSGEQPDYKHVCLGYSEPLTHARTHSENASQTPGLTPLPSANERPNPRTVKSQSPDGPLQYDQSAGGGLDRKVDHTSSQDALVSREPPLSNIRESEHHTTGASPESSRTSLSSSHRTHVPYFRYFGPTAIVPGFKQMVVQVRGSRKSNTSLSSAITESLSPLRSPKSGNVGIGHIDSLIDNREFRDANTIPFYDRNDTLPVSNLVMHLCDLFFVHLGCSFPFLQRDRFLRDLKDKKVDTMLVDAVCALAARFSPHPLLGPPQAPSIDGSELETDVKNSDRGQAFAHRAMGALVDSLSCPTLSVVQACLLLAYEQFGSNHDSGLWMYLGIAIRMAQDLGMQKLQGLQHSYGRRGVTPSAVVSGRAGQLREEEYDQSNDAQVPLSPGAEMNHSEDHRAWEREKVDTFWSIFFLDRVISSGTGRPVTLRDEEIELCFPLQSESKLSNGWPAPFPPLIRIIHLYGRVTDLINGIQDANHVTAETLKRLAGMESDLTGIYQRLSPRLHFNAANFQAYVKAKEGTNFILLHFWFHTLIVLLHQPTLLNSFGGTIQHLYPNSRELSMSSAKTIADILSFSELVDGKSFIGNPFTSQPMYIAACAFLMESAYYSSPPSRSGSPPCQPLLNDQSSGFVMPNMDSSSERKSSAKHILLASAARENYQRCYKALKALETYWEGTRYILTVLDQKAKGIVDPLLYTEEEMENATETFPLPPSAASTYRQAKSPLSATVEPKKAASAANSSTQGRVSPRIDPGQAIGWALTGATNSSQPNLSLLYQMPASQANYDSNRPTYSSQYSHSYPHLPAQDSSSYPQSVETTRASGAAPSSSVSNGPAKYGSLVPPGRVAASDANLLLGLNTSYSNRADNTSNTQPNYTQGLTSSPSSQLQPQPSHFSYTVASAQSERHAGNSHIDLQSTHLQSNMGSNFGGVFIESQDVDVNALQQQEHFPFPFNGEILPYLEYLPQDVLHYFEEQQNYPLMSADENHTRPSE
ncbi:hypothetical protein KXX21_008794 [Aspergillus fumigatus]|nr:hypothetical protein KXX44_006131 [Aspergillus fumigatus]KAH1618790.1 hypothetical protein KXX21_008794 [Aspergillus fumigatus]KAH1913432.1 hypothetical protein KXW69_007388 [Aspergillus fumigatus]KAH2066787.1 hypothetical protein KXX03_001017 [Aspergillus fumigatus]KAH2534195.1 hypothetical protein KXW12_002269 [Aspergillus fumigatus]